LYGLFMILCMDHCLYGEVKNCKEAPKDNFLMYHTLEYNVWIIASHSSTFGIQQQLFVTSP
jgi:hypothetical protein